MCTARCWRIVSRRNISIDAYAAIKMGSGCRAGTIGNILLFGFTIWHRSDAVDQRNIGVFVYGLAQHILYIGLSIWIMGNFMVILWKQFTSRVQIHFGRGTWIYRIIVGHQHWRRPRTTTREKTIKNTMERYIHFVGILRISYRSCSTQLGLLDVAHWNANIYERRFKVRHQKGKKIDENKNQEGFT